MSGAASGQSGHHPDWLWHRLTVAGPRQDLAGFRAAAAGSGVIPWRLELDRREAADFHRLLQPPPGQPRQLSVAGARALARQLREAVAQRHDLALGQVGPSRACPFDLHALLAIPPEILHRGPDDPAAIHWL